MVGSEIGKRNTTNIEYRMIKESTRTYWRQVGKRLKGISKVVLDLSVPIAVEAGINKVCGIIDEKLHKMYRNTVINSLITLILNIVGMLIVFFSPFGTVISKYMAAAFFITSAVIFVTRLVRYISEYGKVTFDVGKNIVAERSVSKGIENYVFAEFPVISLAYTGIEIAANFLPSLKLVPSLNKTIKYFVQTFWRRLAIYAAVVCAYSISVYWIVKPLLLRNIAGVRWYEIYFYPILHIISLFR